jgi:endogenous inhibitor of DNA gyrase (YacG/DUF329 family)
MLSIEYDKDEKEDVMSIVTYIATPHIPFVYDYIYIKEGKIEYTHFGNMDVGLKLSVNDKLYIENDLLYMSYGHKISYSKKGYKKYETTWYNENTIDEKDIIKTECMTCGKDIYLSGVNDNTIFCSTLCENVYSIKLDKSDEKESCSC